VEDQDLAVVADDGKVVGGVDRTRCGRRRLDLP
jgi:hypothetical protein